MSEHTVAREMGHGGFQLVRRAYGHLGEIRHRSEVVEYRIEQQQDALPPDRLNLVLGGEKGIAGLVANPGADRGAKRPPERF